MRGAVTTPRRVHGVGTPAGFLRKQRVVLRSNPPTLVVGEVPVEDVEFVAGHPVDEVEDFRHLQEVPGRVDHRATPREPGHILDPHGHHLHRTSQRCGVDIITAELQQSLGRPQGTPAVGSGDGHAVRTHLESVALGGQTGVDPDENVRLLGDRQRQTRGRGQHQPRCPCGPGLLRSCPGAATDRAALGQRVLRSFPFDSGRKRYQGRHGCSPSSRHRGSVQPSHDLTERFVQPSG